MIFSSFVSILLILLAPPVLQTQEVIPAHDSTDVDVRRPPANMLEDFRSDPDYQYATDRVQSISWFDQLLERFFRWLDDISRDSGQRFIWKYVMYGLAILGIVFAVLQVFKMDGVRLFQKRTRRPGSMYEGISEVLHENDFLKMAREAVEKEDLREAARMYYMHVLQILDKKGDIAWAPRKTNRDYVRECRHSLFRPAFERLTYLFDYSWYGHFPVDRQLVDEMRILAEKIEAEKIEAEKIEAEKIEAGDVHQHQNRAGVVS